MIEKHETRKLVPAVAISFLLASNVTAQEIATPKVAIVPTPETATQPAE